MRAASLLLFLGVVGVAEADDSIEKMARLQERTEMSLAFFYKCTEHYSAIFVATSAPASDVAEAALSACQDQLVEHRKDLVEFIGPKNNPDQLLLTVQTNARRYAIRKIIEARYPGARAK